jgi:hypothetical protein
MISRHAFIVVLIALAGGNSIAAHRSNDRLEPTTVRTATVDLPSSRVEREPLPSPKEEHDKERVEFLLSSWTPHEFTRSQRASSSTPFHSVSAPGFSLSFLMEPVTTLFKAKPTESSLVLKLGFGLYQMERDGHLPLLGVDTKDTQHLYIAPFRVGTFFIPKRFRSFGFDPYLGFSAAPSIMVINSSLLSDGSSSLGLLYELSLGCGFDMHRVWQAVFPKSLEATLGVIQSLGSIDGSPMTGLGVEGGLRLSI